jgi:hypothetical protein
MSGVGVSWRRGGGRLNCRSEIRIRGEVGNDRRTEPASRVERARILLAYREDPSFFAVGRALGLYHQTVQRCVEFATASASDRVACSLREDAGFPLSSRAFLRRCSGCRPADQQFGPPHAATGCICIEVTIAVPVANASASKARMSVVTFMISSAKADTRIGAFFVLFKDAL